MRSAHAAIALLAAVTAASAAPRCTEGDYRNVSGDTIHNPECVNAGVRLKGETAICRDGSHSLSEHRRGTCSHHGGVDHFE